MLLFWLHDDEGGPVPGRSDMPSADVIIVGYGVAGASAALAALERGASVIILERFDGGGASAISGGIYYAGGGTNIQRDAGVEDTPELMLEYLRLEVGDAVKPETLQKFVDGSVDTLNWLQGYGVPFEGSLAPFKTSYPTDDYYLYFSGSESSGMARAAPPPRQRGHRAFGRGVSGKALFAPLADSAERLGADVWRQTRVTGLVVEEGRVVGVRGMTLKDAPAWARRLYSRLTHYATKPGIYYPPMRKTLEGPAYALERRFAKPFEIRADDGVILSSGGFIANRELVRRHAPAYLDGLELGTAGDDGTALKLAEPLGAATGHLDEISAWRFIVPPAAFLGSLLVDTKGQRMIDESRYGAALGKEIVRTAGGVGYLVADQPLVKRARQQLGSQTLWFQRIQAEAFLNVGRKKAGSIEELAAKAGIDPEGLARTVSEHNRAIAGGTPDPLGKPDDIRVPIERAPFYLFNVSIKTNMLNPCPMLTLGGLVVDEETGAVQTTSGAAIPGLYAAGRAAVGICSNSYVSGLSLADCVFSGRRAGTETGRRIDA
ncbi:FAD-binding protein [Mycobacteroides abscessus]|uniref:FAD-binding protein n=1 Tax=Mycobacteroides abscessus TaxID=36809 RepID=UPI0013F68B8E|nr:FAD-binding protein [Mycobacteroides abscessus]